MDWQPIETAPKDGTTIDLWVVGYSDEPGRIVNASYYSDGWWYRDDDLESHPIDRLEPWMTFHGKPAPAVTHWMPLPPPPGLDP
jgi:hypothetical protein